MFRAVVEYREFNDAVRNFAGLMGVSLGEAVKEQAKQLAKRLSDRTYPKSKSQGNNAVSNDIQKVYLRSEFYLNKFNFSNQTFGDKAKQLISAKDAGQLKQLFYKKGGGWAKIKVEDFDASKHKAARGANGRVTYKSPFSFPLNDSAIKKLIKTNQKNVGMARSGWAFCYGKLGGSVPSWLNKSGTGRVEDNSAAENPSITITNTVRYFADLDAKHGIVVKAMAGRATAMIKAAEMALARAARDARLT